MQPKQSPRKLKSSIITQIRSVLDTDLLQEIYITLNKTTLKECISEVISRDTDTKGYVDKLVDIIISTPGSYEEKLAFIKQYPNGYIDIDRMLSGDYVTFENLISGPPGSPIAFVIRLFNELKQTTFGTSKGPGEFGLAVLSPRISITGKGDLNIDDKIIEVKSNVGSSGGRLGSSGLLQCENNAAIIQKYIDAAPIPAGRTKRLNVLTDANVNLTDLLVLCTDLQLDSVQRAAMATELFDYIFGYKVDIGELVSNTISGTKLDPAFLKANYELYQLTSKFCGMMLMNFRAGALKYFITADQMFSEIYATGVYLVSKDKQFQPRQILSQVTLRPVITVVPKVVAVAKSVRVKIKPVTRLTNPVQYKSVERYPNKNGFPTLRSITGVPTKNGFPTKDFLAYSK